MLVAEIRHKLAAIEALDSGAVNFQSQVKKLLAETKEDLLTADVFGSLKYLPRKPYLEAVLNAIRDRNIDAIEFRHHLPAVLAGIEGLEFHFWPQYPTPADLDSTMTEPDVELTSTNTLILVEAKLHSGFGQQQVARELAVAHANAQDKQFFVLLVTMGLKQPDLPPMPDWLRAVSLPCAVGQLARHHRVPASDCQPCRRFRRSCGRLQGL